MTSKDLFLVNKELSSQLAAVANSTWFGQCLLYVRGTIMEGNITSEELSGAKKFEKALMTLADSQYVAPEPLRCKLNHAIDNPRVAQPKA